MNPSVENASLTHLNDQGEAHMVDISEKVATKREAIAVGEVKRKISNKVLVTSPLEADYGNV